MFRVILLGSEKLLNNSKFKSLYELRKTYWKCPRLKITIELRKNILKMHGWGFLVNS